MMHSVDELFGLVYRYYPRGMWDFEPGYDDTVEYRRLDAARKQAASCEAWHKLLERLRIRLDDGIYNRSLALASFKSDACTWVTHPLPPDPSRNSSNNDEDHEIGIAISFIAPYYVVYSSRKVDRIYRELEPKRLHPFDLDDDEKVDAHVMVEEMSRLFPKHEPMPSDVGNLVVPDVMAGNQGLGKATLYHCFFTDSW
jgi:hypothetical protein